MNEGVRKFDSWDRKAVIDAVEKHYDLKFCNLAFLS